MVQGWLYKGFQKTPHILELIIYNSSTSLSIPHKHIVNHQVECQIGKGDLTLHMGITFNG
jgi:hypothetical protein